MLNSDIYELKLKRLNVCDISLALLQVIWDLKEEAHDPKTTEKRKEICLRPVEKWERLHNEINNQLHGQDEERGF